MEEMEANEVDAVPPHGVRCRNVYFEETPARLITCGIITEHGALACEAAQHACARLMHPCTQALSRLLSWLRGWRQRCAACLRTHSWTTEARQRGDATHHASESTLTDASSHMGEKQHAYK